MAPRKHQRRQPRQRGEGETAIGLVAHDGAGKAFVVKPRHLIEPFAGAEADEIRGIDLLGLVPIANADQSATKHGDMTQPRLPVEPHRLLGLSIARIGTDGKEYPGQISALRGLVRLRDREGLKRQCLDLIELQFDETRTLLAEKTKKKLRLPALKAADVGSLVIDARDGGAVGILIGKVGRNTAFAVPLAPFLEAHKLVLGVPGREGEQTRRDSNHNTAGRGIETFIDELAREEQLDLDRLPGKAA